MNIWSGVVTASDVQDKAWGKKSVFQHQKATAPKSHCRRIWDFLFWEQVERGIRVISS